LFWFSAVLSVFAPGCVQTARLPEKKEIEFPLPSKTAPGGFTTSQDTTNPQNQPKQTQTAGYPTVAPGPSNPVKNELMAPPPTALAPKSPAPLPVTPVSQVVVPSPLPSPPPMTLSPPSSPMASNQGVIPAGGPSTIIIDNGAANRAGSEAVERALACILKDRPSEAIDCLKGYDAATQRLLLELLRPIAILAQKKLQELGPMEVARLTANLSDLLESLRPRSSLVIDQACFCQSVKSFGNYQPLPDGHVFVASLPERPGERVQFYVQLRNFASVLRDGAYETRLASSVEIHNAKGEKIWYYNFNDRQHPVRRQAQLHDYFSNYLFNVPHLPPGSYVLTIQITDETIPEAPRPARKSLEFRVGATTAAQR